MPTMQRSPTTASPTRSGTRRRCAHPRARASSPAATTTRTASPASPRAPAGFPGGNGPILPRETATIAAGPAHRTAGTRTGSARTTTCRSRRPGIGGPKRHWPLQQGLRPVLRVHRRRDQPVVSGPGGGQPHDRAALPARGGLPPLQGLADQALRISCDASQTIGAVPALVHVVLPRRQPRAAPRRPQEWADKYKGQFDDGYEAYREWVLPRMIEKGILPRGHRADAAQPDARGHVQPGRHGAPVGLARRTRRSPFARMAEVYAGFSEYTDHQVGRIIDYLENTGQLENTLVMYCADNGASGEGSPNGSVNENKFFNGWPDDHRGQPRASRRTGQPEHLQPLPHRLGGSVLDAVQDVQALLVRGRHLRPAGHLLAGRHQGARRGPPPVPPRHRHRARPSSIAVGVEFPDELDGRRAGAAAGVSMRYSFDAG